MKTDAKLIKKLANLGLSANMVHGGVSQTSLHLEETKYGYVMTAKTPSLNPESYQLEIRNNMLIFYTVLPNVLEDDNENESNSRTVVPAFIRTFPILPHVDIENIEASYDSGELRVYAPFRKDVSNNDKRIDIKF